MSTFSYEYSIREFARPKASQISEYEYSRLKGIELSTFEQGFGKPSINESFTLEEVTELDDFVDEMYSLMYGDKPTNPYRLTLKQLLLVVGLGVVLFAAYHLTYNVGEGELLRAIRSGIDVVGVIYFLSIFLWILSYVFSGTSSFMESESSHSIKVKMKDYYLWHKSLVDSSSNHKEYIHLLDNNPEIEDQPK